ncbi:MAG: hypothetical protein KJO47_01045 [Gammaproteobacteria bacterium]|nr:hypothetical protein [Gammaproteobacteria bacterium]NNC66527.1 hypothetical protein [Gammaproteobacteria bacterium]
MLIVPVIDLCKGIVVHALKGNRKEYKAIDSKLCSSASPLVVINAYLKVFNFNSIYIADLDALEQQDGQIEIIESICSKYPELEIWLDTGSLLIEHYLQNTKLQNLRLILSSESLSSADSFSSLLVQYPQHNFILSLDYKADKLLGPQELLQYKQQWPKDVIVLNLNNVGARRGYLFPTELNQDELTSCFNIYYGGGIRDFNDIKKLKSHGLTGTLVSTALHNQVITGNDIRLLNQ